MEQALWERSRKNCCLHKRVVRILESWMDDEPTSIYTSGLVKIEYLSWKRCNFNQKFPPALEQEYQRTVPDAAALTTFLTQFIPRSSKQFTWWYSLLLYRTKYLLLQYMYFSRNNSASSNATCRILTFMSQRNHFSIISLSNVLFQDWNQEIVPTKIFFPKHFFPTNSFEKRIDSSCFLYP